MADQMHTYPVSAVRKHSFELATFYFERPFAVHPGQFVTVWLPGVDEKPISVSDVDGDRLELTVKAVGPFTRAMMAVGPGDFVGLRGPFGTGFTLQDNILLVAGGMGMAPMRFLARECHRKQLRTSLLVGARDATNLVFAEDFLEAGARLFTDDGSMGTQGLVTQELAGLLAENTFRTVAACGPEPMLLAVLDAANRHGLECQLALERYMKCGIGICGQCCLDGSGLRVCKEGPVLTSRQLQNVAELGKPHRDATGRRRSKS